MRALDPEEMRTGELPAGRKPAESRRERAFPDQDTARDDAAAAVDRRTAGNERGQASDRPAQRG